MSAPGKVGRSHPEQSWEAAANVASGAATQRQAILSLVRPVWPDGLTNRELSEMLGIPPNQIATRTLELRESGDLEKVVDESGREVTRETTPGNRGWVQRYKRAQLANVNSGGTSVSTESLSLVDLVEPDETRRDRHGRYLVRAGGKLVPHTRVTTVASTLGTEFGLGPWKATMTAIGAMLRPGLRARWEALIAEHDGDPWYGSQAGKKACQKLVEDCCTVGGGSDRAEIGTALHALAALIDWGRTPSLLSEQTEADLTAYVNGLVEAGVSVVPEMIELTVVLDEYHVAGSFDRLVRVPGFALPLIGDLKTGRSLEHSWHEIAVQLAAYSRADAIYVQGADPNGSEDIRTAMPEVDQHHGLVMWLPAGEARLELFLVDLDAGWEAFQKSMWTREWRNRKVWTPLAEYEPDLVPLLEASIALVEADKYTQRLREWLQGRIDAIGRHTDAAKAELGSRWPLGLPTLKRSTTHSPEELDVIEAVLDDVEKRHSVPFGDPRPSTDVVGLLLHLFPGSSVEDEPPINNKETPTS